MKTKTKKAATKKTTKKPTAVAIPTEKLHQHLSEQAAKFLTQEISDQEIIAGLRREAHNASSDHARVAALDKLAQIYGLYKAPKSQDSPQPNQNSDPILIQLIQEAKALGCPVEPT